MIGLWSLGLDPALQAKPPRDALPGEYCTSPRCVSYGIRGTRCCTSANHRQSRSDDAYREGRLMFHVIALIWKTKTAGQHKLHPPFAPICQEDPACWGIASWRKGGSVCIGTLPLGFGQGGGALCPTRCLVGACHWRLNLYRSESLKLGWRGRASPQQKSGGYTASHGRPSK